MGPATNLAGPHNAPAKGALSQDEAGQRIGPLVALEFIRRGDHARSPIRQTIIVGEWLRHGFRPIGNRL
jgi:hypothetical protein